MSLASIARPGACRRVGVVGVSALSAYRRVGVSACGRIGVAARGRLRRETLERI